MNAIDTFLLNWKESVKTYYLDLKEKRSELNLERMRLRDQYKLHSQRPNQVLPADYVEAQQAVKNFDQSITKSDSMIISRIAYSIKELDSILNREMAAKKKALIAKIEKKAGAIVDASHLTVAGDGNINGYVQGEKAMVTVSTIIAGGYNIQRVHYRVIVK